METSSLSMVFILAILGHFVGDYIFQPVWMALGKSERTLRGFFICLVHCLIYAGAVVLLTATVTNPWVWAVAFLSHFWIDRESLGQKWLDFIGGRNIMTDWEKSTAFARDKGLDQMHIAAVSTAFAAIVYTVVDNTFHILLLLGGLYFLHNNGLL